MVACKQEIPVHHECARKHIGDESQVKVVVPSCHHIVTAASGACKLLDKFWKLTVVVYHYIFLAQDSVYEGIRE